MKALLVLLLCCFVISVLGSSHSEAPNTALISPADITDLWAFRSYEPGRTVDYVTFLVGVYPLQSPFGGPNYYTLSDGHFYELYIDANSNGYEDYVFQWVFGSSFPAFTPTHNPTYIYLDDYACSPVNVTPDSIPPVQPPSAINSGIELLIATGQSVQIALKVAGFVLTDSTRDAAAAKQGLAGGGSLNNLNWNEYYSINLIAGNVSTPTSQTLLQTKQGLTTFNKPFDYSGEWAFGLPATYEAWATGPSFLYTLDLSNPALFGGKCNVTDGRAWVGQRNEPFYISLGRIFDYLNFVPVVLSQFQTVTIIDCLSNNDLAERNMDTIALEIPSSCLGSPDGIINVWAATRRLFHPDNDTSPTNTAGSAHYPGYQVSRMGNPLVNELVIGLIDKQRFSRQTPRLDAPAPYGFLQYVQYPTLPTIISARYLAAANILLNPPTKLTSLAPPTPRNDLVAVFLTGIKGVNQGVGGFPGEVMRLNTGIAPVLQGKQNPLGIVGTLVSPGTFGSDLAGYPNGRRPGDDVVDISLMVMMGAVCSQQFINAGFFLCPQNNGTALGISCPLASVVLRDGAPVKDIYYKNQFPYFNTPTPGSYLDGAPGNVVQDPTVCYPQGQLGRCPVCAGSSSTTGSTGTTATSATGTTTCAGTSLVPWSFLVMIAKLLGY